MTIYEILRIHFYYEEKFYEIIQQLVIALAVIRKQIKKLFKIAAAQKIQKYTAVLAKIEKAFLVAPRFQRYIVEFQRRRRRNLESKGSIVIELRFCSLSINEKNDSILVRIVIIRVSDDGGQFRPHPRYSVSKTLIYLILIVRCCSVCKVSIEFIFRKAEFV